MARVVHKVKVKHEMHFGAQRFVICECSCGWVSPSLPKKLRARLPVCGNVRPLVLKQFEVDLRRHFNQTN